MNRSKLVILLMLLAGCLMGGLAVIFHHTLSRRAIAWWGAEDVEMIRNALRVEAIRLAPIGGSASADFVTIDGIRYNILERRDVSGVHGIDHIRHALLEDAHFDWEKQSAGRSPPTWQFALIFVSDSQQLTVAFERDHVGRSDRADLLTLTGIATGWSEFFNEQFATSAQGTSRSSGIRKNSDE